jgi:beta-glucosidase
LAAFSDYRIKGRMYRYFEGEPLFPFGFGLSYTSFAYRNLTLPKQAKAGEQLQISVDVGNTGGMAGERFDVAPRELPTVGTDGRTVAKPGAFEIWAGGKQPGFRGLADAATSGILSGKFTIGGTAKELD